MLPLLLLTLAGAGPGAARQQLDPERYRALVEETAGGLFMNGGRELATFRVDSVGAVVRGFLREDPGALRLQAAAMLHTEAALNVGAARHLDFARELLDAIPYSAEREEWRRRWWLAVGYSYHLALNTAAAVAHFEKGVEAFPGDRDIRLALARVAQMAGRQREEQSYSRRAVELLAGLAEEDPEDPEIRVRLAGALFDTGDRAGAAFQLARLEGVRIPPWPRLGSLLLQGGMALDAGDYPAAETAFAEAVRRARRSPGAVSGLVAARLAQGKAAEAFAAAKALLARRPVGWEPEWRFWLGPAADMREMFEAMKTEIRTGFAEEGAG